MGLQEALLTGLDPELGNPTTRKPRTAILNCECQLRLPAPPPTPWR